MERVYLFSFGFQVREPPTGCVVFDARGIKNPERDRTLRKWSGLHGAVQAEVMAHPRAQEIVEEGGLALMAGHRVAIGCSFGRHRSVALADVLARRAREAGMDVEVEHLDLRLKRFALDPEEREKVCRHEGGFAFRGKIPCTGPRVCRMCGTREEEA